MSDDTINLRVKGDDGEVFFKTKVNTPLQTLMDAYCSKTGKNPGGVRFLANGDRINPSDTPASLGLEENDILDAVVEH